MFDDGGRLRDACIARRSRVPETAFMATIGGGVQVPVSHHWAIDADYRFSRIAADTPLNAHGATFGVGYRF